LDVHVVLHNWLLVSEAQDGHLISDAGGLATELLAAVIS
jgi:hypothetical protein